MKVSNQGFKGFMTQKSTVFILFLYGGKDEYKIGLLKETLKFLKPSFSPLKISHGAKFWLLSLQGK